MVRGNLALKNGFVHLEGATPFGDVFADVSGACIVDLSTFAYLAFAHHRVLLRINDDPVAAPVVIKLKFRFVLLVQNEDCGERFTGLAAESVQWSDFAIGYQRADFFRTQLAAGNILVQTESACFAVIGSIVFFQMQRTAFRATDRKSTRLNSSH